MVLEPLRWTRQALVDALKSQWMATIDMSVCNERKKTLTGKAFAEIHGPLCAGLCMAQRSLGIALMS